MANNLTSDLLQDAYNYLAQIFEVFTLWWFLAIFHFGGAWVPRALKLSDVSCGRKIDPKHEVWHSKTIYCATLLFSLLHWVTGLCHGLFYLWNEIVCKKCFSCIFSWIAPQRCQTNILILIWRLQYSWLLLSNNFYTFSHGSWKWPS